VFLCLLHRLVRGRGRGDRRLLAVTRGACWTPSPVAGRAGAVTVCVSRGAAAGHDADGRVPGRGAGPARDAAALPIANRCRCAAAGKRAGQVTRVARQRLGRQFPAAAAAGDRGHNLRCWIGGPLSLAATRSVTSHRALA
jgi:hypothetical protein